jgi:NAD(P)H dehydrogenase (quinone)
MKRTIICGFLFGTLFVNFYETQGQVNVLVVYYSERGHTAALAESVANGARSVSVDQVQVKLLSVNEAQPADVLAADTIIIGSPVFNGNVAPPIQTFINSWPFEGAPLRDKIGAAFVTAGGISAGEELTQLSILHSMLLYGMIIVGGRDWTQAFGASAIVDEKPFDEKKEGSIVDFYFLRKGEALGRRVAELAVKIKCTNSIK